MNDEEAKKLHDAFEQAWKDMPLPDEYKGQRVPNNRDWTGQCGCNKDKSDDWKAGFNWAMNCMALWIDFRMNTLYYPFDQLKSKTNSISIEMYKSELLGRIIRGEPIRTKPCPRHKGVMWCAWGSNEMISHNWSCCDGTGWIKD